MRMFFCDPFGHTQPENLFNHGSDIIHEHDYVFFHDQEPVQFAAHKSLFREVLERNGDLCPQPQGYIVVSERGQEVEKLCDIYGWKPYYYFFHGWACLDWFRGYHRTFLLEPPMQRQSLPNATFMSPNRIIGGERDHRVLWVYHVLTHGLDRNHISCPAQCPVEQTAIADVAQRYVEQYPDIQEVIGQAKLPWLFQGEETQRMTSCWLSNFAEASDSMIYVPTETVYFGRRTHLTEKTFKAIALGMPFVLVAPAGSLSYLREYGFQTFGHIWDESYDTETDDFARLEKVAKVLYSIEAMSTAQRREICQEARVVAQANWDHFYHGGFEQILWKELQGLLKDICV